MNFCHRVILKRLTEPVADNRKSTVSSARVIKVHGIHPGGQGTQLPGSGRCTFPDRWEMQEWSTDGRWAGGFPRTPCCENQHRVDRGAGPGFILRRGLLLGSPFDHLVAETWGPLLNSSDPVSSVGYERTSADLLGNV